MQFSVFVISVFFLDNVQNVKFIYPIILSEKQLGDTGLEIDEVQPCNSITQGQGERIPKT